jgi:DNA polymerase/3'-5' exonuclease PolX
MELTRAREIAERVLALLRPFCNRAEIAGSLRRGKLEVGDIEIVVMPKDAWFEFRVPGLFDCCVFIKNGTRYKKIILAEGIVLDLFIVLPPAQWGVIFTLRTGPAEFSYWIVNRRSCGGRLPSDCRVRDGQVSRNGAPLPMPEEEDFLRLLELDGLAPSERGAQVPPNLYDRRGIGRPV